MTALEQLEKHLSECGFRRVLVITDENVDSFYPYYFDCLKAAFDVESVVVPSGEASKSIETAARLWRSLAEKCHDKNTFIVNFGGGMVSDLGGFVASTYKRGLHYANMPTTLMAMIDASVGGKTAVNIDGLKNAVGTFHFPDIVFKPDMKFLDTLPKRELESGFGELVKYAMIGSPGLFAELYGMSGLCAKAIKQEWISFCIELKNDIVKKDPYDNGMRHVLNFGHTIGHAIESLSAEIEEPVSHGLAVAQGMFYESYLSYKKAGLPEEGWKKTASFLSSHFGIRKITEENFGKMTRFLLNDKKNEGGAVNFTLLREIGEPVTDCSLRLEELAELLTKTDFQI
ncbi:MAG: 3-dehydroquinate synthase [Bacteroidales bacterium]|nr:3-dehydroquinate synthase [Bacteroidales bacterium]